MPLRLTKSRKNCLKVFVFIKNEPRSYAWGSTDAIAKMLRQDPTGEPQAELWLGDHEGAPAKVANQAEMTLIDLIKSAPEVYGVNGGRLPFLLKILGIGAPLSLQVHPNLEQAERGFDTEEAAGIALSAPERSYKDRNHKPELLVALSEVRALAGFRPLRQVLEDLAKITEQAGTCGARGAQPLYALQAKLFGALALDATGVLARRQFFDWVFSGSEAVRDAIAALTQANERSQINFAEKPRAAVISSLSEHYPGDPGVLVSLFLHILELQPGESIFVQAGEMHAYLSGVGVEVMASSDNVLRAGLTPKHVDVEGLLEILNFEEAARDSFKAQELSEGHTVWIAPVPDFMLHRVRVKGAEAAFEQYEQGSALEVKISARWPLVLIATEGLLRVERDVETELDLASVSKGQSLYISAGTDVTISGRGEAFVASVGASWAKLQH